MIAASSDFSHSPSSPMDFSGVSGDFRRNRNTNSTFGFLVYSDVGRHHSVSLRVSQQGRSDSLDPRHILSSLMNRSGTPRNTGDSPKLLKRRELIYLTRNRRGEVIQPEVDRRNSCSIQPESSPVHVGTCRSSCRYFRPKKWTRSGAALRTEQHGTETQGVRLESADTGCEVH